MLRLLAIIKITTYYLILNRRMGAPLVKLAPLAQTYSYATDDIQ